MARTRPTHHNGGTAYLSNGEGYNVIAVDTDGTTAVNVFGSKGVPADLTVTAVVSIALDTTAGNITLTGDGNTIATIAKGTTSGTLVGATSLADTSVEQGDTITVVSSSEGNSTVLVYYKHTTP